MGDVPNDVAALVKQMVMAANGLTVHELTFGGTVAPDNPPPALLSDIARIRQLLEKWDREGVPPARFEA